MLYNRVFRAYYKFSRVRLFGKLHNSGSRTHIIGKCDHFGAAFGVDKKQRFRMRLFYFRCPDKKFYPLSKDLLCHNMKITTLADVLNCLEGRGGEEIVSLFYRRGFALFNLRMSGTTARQQFEILFGYLMSHVRT